MISALSDVGNPTPSLQAKCQALHLAAWKCATLGGEPTPTSLKKFAVPWMSRHDAKRSEIRFQHLRTLAVVRTSI